MTSFTFGTTDLSTIGNITVIDEYLDMPERRGENQTVAFRHGTIFTEKFFNERKITFGIAIIKNTLADLETALDTLRLVLSPRTQQTLTIVFENASTKTALATVDRSIEVTRTQTMARVVVEFTLTSPFLRDASAIADNTLIIDADPINLVFDNTGTAEERDPTILISGPFSSVTLTNIGISVTYTGAIGAGETVEIGTLNGEYYATHSVSGNVIGNVTHAGSSCLLPIPTGTNTVTITSAGGNNTGTVKISFYPPYV